MAFLNSLNDIIKGLSTSARGSNSRDHIHQAKSKDRKNGRSISKSKSAKSSSSFMLDRYSVQSGFSKASRLTYIKPKPRPVYQSLGMGPVNFIFDVRKASQYFTYISTKYQIFFESSL